MPEIKSPVFQSGAPTGPISSISDIGDQTTVDPLRQYMIFEMVNVDSEHDAQVPQGNPIFPYMVMHMNPENFDESFTKLITRQVTRGGYLEQHWGEELDNITCSGSTGAFISIRSGLSVLNRKASIAYRKHLELVALYRNGGHVYDQRGNIVMHGGINLHFDSNIFHGFFENLTVNETADNPFTFTVDFSFKVERSLRSVGN